MTRLEVNICQAAIEKFNPFQAMIKTLFHSKVQAAIDHLVEKVLNDRHVVSKVYHKLSLPTLIGFIGRCCVNLMIVGKTHSWIVNTRATH